MHPPYGTDAPSFLSPTSGPSPHQTTTGTFWSKCCQYTIVIVCLTEIHGRSDSNRHQCPVLVSVTHQNLPICRRWPPACRHLRHFLATSSYANNISSCFSIPVRARALPEFTTKRDHSSAASRHLIWSARAQWRTATMTECCQPASKILAPIGATHPIESNGASSSRTAHPHVAQRHCLPCPASRIDADGLLCPTMKPGIQGSIVLGPTMPRCSTPSSARSAVCAVRSPFHSGVASPGRRHLDIEFAKRIFI